MRLVLQAGSVINRVSKALQGEVGFPAETGWFERCLIPTGVTGGLRGG